MPEQGTFHRGRHAGVLVPLFSIPSQASWGIGEIADLPRFAAWLQEAGLDFVQLLPVNEMEDGQNSPYAALTAMAIDPIFVAIDAIPDFAETGGVEALSAEDRRRLAHARGSKAVDYGTVRAVKRTALRRCFSHFRERHAGTGSERDRAFQEFRNRERWWLADYALFRALHNEQGGRYWREWEPGLRDREPGALEIARNRLVDDLSFYEYLQWVADSQWQEARRSCGRVGLFGDFPFMVNGHSADVWARQGQFNINGSIGVPPDPTSETGQDWGLPAPRWDVMAADDHEWVRQRVRRCVALFDGFRIDHLVGFYRTFVRERSGASYFTPPDEPSQLAQGERLMRLFLDGGSRIIAEDLGVVPDFVRESLSRLQIAGLKVLRWERQWKQEGQPFRRPSEYAGSSVAMSGTHDTETMAEWWDGAAREERRLCADLPGLAEAGCGPDAGFSPAIRDALISVLFESGSELVIVPFQDAFGWRDRVNVPGIVAGENWTWRLPWPVDQLSSVPDARARAGFLRQLSERTSRWS